MLKAQAPVVAAQMDSSQKLSCQQINVHIVIKSKTSYCTVIRFIVAGHFPKMYGKLSGHSGNGLVFVACVMNESAERFISIVVFSYPQPGALDERTA